MPSLLLITFLHVEEVSSLRQKLVSVVSFASDTPTAKRQEVRNVISQNIFAWLSFTDHWRFIFWAPFMPSFIQCVYSYHSIDISFTPCLYLVTPERLCSFEFLKLLDGIYGKGQLNRLVVDEVRKLDQCLVLFSSIYFPVFFRRTAYQ